MALADEDTSVVDGLGKTELVDASLKTALQEVLDLEGQDVIELHAGLVEDTDTYETADEGVTLEEALGVLLVKGQERTAVKSENCCNCAQGSAEHAQRMHLPGSTTDLGEGELDAPHLALVAQTILANELELSVPVPPLTRCPRHKRSKLALSGRGMCIRTDERTRKDDGGRCTSSSRNGAPLLLSLDQKRKFAGVVRNNQGRHCGRTDGKRGLANGEWDGGSLSEPWKSRPLLLLEIPFQPQLQHHEVLIPPHSQNGSRSRSPRGYALCVR